MRVALAKAECKYKGTEADPEQSQRAILSHLNLLGYVTGHFVT